MVSRWPHCSPKSAPRLSLSVFALFFVAFHSAIAVSDQQRSLLVYPSQIRRSSTARCCCCVETSPSPQPGSLPLHSRPFFSVSITAPSLFVLAIEPVRSASPFPSPSRCPSSCAESTAPPSLSSPLSLFLPQFKTASMFSSQIPKAASPLTLSLSHLMSLAAAPLFADAQLLLLSLLFEDCRTAEQCRRSPCYSSSLSPNFLIPPSNSLPKFNINVPIL